MSDSESRRFRRTLTLVLVLLGLLTAGSVLLFGHLLFRDLSKDVVSDALFHSKIDAERLAKGLEARSLGDLYTLRYKQTEYETLLGSTISDRRVVNEVQVLDKAGKLLYSYKSVLERGDPSSGALEGGAPVQPVSPVERSSETTLPIDDPYNIEVPIGNLGVLRVGVSRRELAFRVEKLRRELYLRTFAAASVSLLGIFAASTAVLLLLRRTRRAEAARTEAERRAELGEVAAGLAHEIRNPLNSMSLNLELLEEQLEKGGTAGPAPATTELAHAVRVETGRLARMLGDFLSYARPSPIAPVPSDLNVVASDAVTFLRPEATKRGIRLEFSPAPGPAAARLDEARVRQVILNLVGNALDAVESEGALAREVDVRVEEDGPRWLLLVTDRGPGIPAATQREMFKVFVSTKPAGTGLGLPIAERIVKAHGGSLLLVSEAGHPTRAEARFPKG